MKEAFELIKERLKAEVNLYEQYDDFCSIGRRTAYRDALRIVSEVEAEYDNGKTNADHIRSMSDSELAWFLCGVFDDDECDGKYICGETIPHYDEDKIVEWLKSPTTD